MNRRKDLGSSVMPSGTNASPKILFLVTEDWYFRLHWIGLARTARDAGFDVLLAMRVQDHGEEIAGYGFKLFPIGLVRRSLNPIREFWTVLELARLYRSEKPDIVYHVAVKPILYGSVAARLARVPFVINVFAGLGYAYASNYFKARLVRLFLCSGLRLATAGLRPVTVFQNEEDQDQLVRDGVVERGQTRVIRGTGVDTDRFQPMAGSDQDPVVLLAGRMLWDKGIGEFVEAAKILQTMRVRARFVLAGRCDDDNPASIRVDQLRQWQEQKIVEWWGQRNDMPIVYGKASVVVLPSYREGFPVSLLEAAACGKAIVATDVPGCREIIQHRINGLLVPPKDAQALADAIAQLLNDKKFREQLGMSGRTMVVKQFAAETVMGQTIELYRELLERPGYRS